LLDLLATEKSRALQLTKLVGKLPDDYLPWPKLRRRQVPEHAAELLRTTPENESSASFGPLTVNEWWAILRYSRDIQVRAIPSLTQVSGHPLRFVLTDRVLRETEFVESQIGLGLSSTDGATRDRYIKSALEEEAITSSQLEGAVTSRRVAKEMLRNGRQPRTLSERMIFNNFAAMQRVRELRDQALTPELVCEIHRIVTDGTLDNPDDAGRLQSPDEPRVKVVHIPDDEVVHEPPPAEELPGRLDRLCRFVNGVDGGPYLPGVLRALTVHFITSYDHYFVDGNGRTARALFYWSMLHQGYWLAEFLTISTILRKAPVQYAQSFIDTEDDDGDLTYFYMYHLKVLHQAIDGLRDYIARTLAEQQDIRARLDPAMGEFNLRQLAVLSDANQEPSRRFTAAELAHRFSVTTQTARNDLDDLVGRRLMIRGKQGRQFAWHGSPDLATQLALVTNPKAK